MSKTIENTTKECLPSTSEREKFLLELKIYIASKMARMQSEGLNPFLTKPITANQEQASILDASRHIARIIKSVYGEHFPLPNICPDFNASQIQSGSYLPLLGGFVENGVHRPVMTAGIRLDQNGFAELGRTARDPAENSFIGGALSMSRLVHWLEDPKLRESIHTMYSQIRVSGAHAGIPPSEAVQNLILGRAGFAPLYLAPLYDVGGDDKHEWFLEVARSRSRDEMISSLQKDLVVVPGVHENLLRELLKGQLGTEAKTIDLQFQNPKQRGKKPILVPSDLDSVYGEVYFDTQENGTEYCDLDSFESAPTWFAKIPGTRDALPAQQVLLDLGFEVCGVRPGGSRVYGTMDQKQVVNLPPLVYFTRAGRKKSENFADLGLCENSHGKQLIDPPLTLELQNLVKRITMTT